MRQFFLAMLAATGLAVLGTTAHGATSVSQPNDNCAIHAVLLRLDVLLRPV